MTLIPSNWQIGSVKLSRGSDPLGLGRVSGLDLNLTAPNNAWPLLGCRGGVATGAQGAGHLYSVSQLVGNTGVIPPRYDFMQTIAMSPLGQISVPGQSAGSVVEETDWSSITLSYAGLFDLTLSRATVSMLIETAASVDVLRMLSGTVTKRTIGGSPNAVTETPSSAVLPKYVAWHAADGYHVSAISDTPVVLTGMDQPWLLVWFGDQSHFAETTIPLHQQNYHWAAGTGTNSIHPRYGFTADCPLLIMCSTVPTQIARDVDAASGFDLSFAGGSGAKVLSVTPLYGRARQKGRNNDGTTLGCTEAWSSGLPSTVQNRVQAIWPTLCQFPGKMSESYGYNSGSDVATITENVTWTQVSSNASGVRFAPLPPVLGVARTSGLNNSIAISGTGTIVDIGIPTEYGPTVGMTAVDQYSWSVSGLNQYVVPRGGLGNGNVPSGLQTRIDSEVDKLISVPHWQPWRIDPGSPNGNCSGEAYWANPADSLALIAEVLPAVSGSRRTALLDWLKRERDSYPPETIYKLPPTAGVEPGPEGVSGEWNNYWDHPYSQSWLFATRQWIYCAWGLARYHQESGVAVRSGLTDALLGVLDGDMYEQDWATGHWFFNVGERQTAVENATRHWAGLAGLLWIIGQQSGSDVGAAAICRALFAKATVTRIAMTKLPRWLSSVGLVSLPTDLGTPAKNAAWTVTTACDYPGWIWTADWDNATKDPRSMILMDQYHALLGDHNGNQYFARQHAAYVPAYRYMTKSLASLLASTCPNEPEVTSKKFTEFRPAWYIPFAPAAMGSEFSYQLASDAHSILMSRAWLEGISAQILEHEACVPWVDSGGDLFTINKYAEVARVYAGLAPSGPTITDIADNGTVARRTKFEVTCQVSSSVATMLDMPYDATWQANGLTVNVRFSNSDFITSHVMPCVYIADYDHSIKNGQDHFYPLGTGKWTARFSPPIAGNWQYRVEATDANGPVSSTVHAFTVTNATVKGPVQPALQDPRYFEHEDGTYFHAQGVNVTFDLGNINNPSTVAGPMWDDTGANGISLVRTWAIDWGIIGGTMMWQSPLYSGELDAFKCPAEDAPLVPYLDHEYAAKSSGYTVPILGLMQKAPAVKSSTKYRVKVRYSIPTALLGPLDGVNPYGLTIKINQIWLNDQVSYHGSTIYQYEQPGLGTRLVAPVHAVTNGWQEMSGTFTTRSNQNWMDMLWICQENRITGTPPAYIDAVWIEEVIDEVAGIYGPNILGRAQMQSHAHVDQYEAAHFDTFVQRAEDAGVYLKLVMCDRFNYFGYHLDATTNQLVASVSEDHFYGTAGSRVRFVHAAWARQFVGRHGYRNGIHSWEFVNEGNNANWHIMPAADAWAAAIKSYGNAKMCTVSFWGGSPASNWNAAPNLDYADLHAYHSRGTDAVNNVGNSTSVVIHRLADWYDSAAWAKHLSDTVGALSAGCGMNKPMVFGEGTLRDEFEPGASGGWTEEYVKPVDVSDVYRHKRVWAQIGSGGVIDIGEWYWQNTMVRTVAPIINRRNEFKPFYDFISSEPLNNGHYVDIGASCTDSHLRVVGQKDTTNKRAHLWIDNVTSTWGLLSGKVAGPTLVPASGNVSFIMPQGRYQVTWHDCYSDNVVVTQTIDVGIDGIVSLVLPFAITTDIALKMAPMSAPVQHGRAASVVSAGNWTAVGADTIVHALDEDVPSDADYAISGLMPDDDELIVELTPIEVPNSGVQVVRYRLSRDVPGTFPMNFEVVLTCGEDVIATWSHAGIGDNPTTITQVLTSEQVAAVSDWTNVQVHISATEVRQ